MKITKSSSLAIKIAFVIALVIFAVATRLLPHPANFAPIAAIAIFGGAVLPRRWALVLPLLAMIVSDLIIGLHPLVFYTWGTFAVIALISNKVLKNIRPTSVVAMSLISSVLFYVVTNFAVWAQNQMYPMTASGLVHCYVNAIPFFRNTLLGDLIYTTLLFGVFALVTSVAKTYSTQKTASLKS